MSEESLDVLFLMDAAAGPELDGMLPLAELILRLLVPPLSLLLLLMLPLLLSLVLPPFDLLTVAYQRPANEFRGFVGASCGRDGGDTLLMVWGLFFGFLVAFGHCC